jgi:hypothetical protein
LSQPTSQSLTDVYNRTRLEYISTKSKPEDSPHSPQPLACEGSHVIDPNNDNSPPVDSASAKTSASKTAGLFSLGTKSSAIKNSRENCHAQPLSTTPERSTTDPTYASFQSRAVISPSQRSVPALDEIRSIRKRLASTPQRSMNSSPTAMKSSSDPLYTDSTLSILPDGFRLTSVSAESEDDFQTVAHRASSWEGSLVVPTADLASNSKLASTALQISRNNSESGGEYIDLPLPSLGLASGGEYQVVLPEDDVKNTAAIPYDGDVDLHTLESPSEPQIQTAFLLSSEAGKIEPASDALANNTPHLAWREDLEILSTPPFESTIESAEATHDVNISLNLVLERHASVSPSKDDIVMTIAEPSQDDGKTNLPPSTESQLDIPSVPPLEVGDAMEIPKRPHRDNVDLPLSIPEIRDQRLSETTSIPPVVNDTRRLDENVIPTAGLASSGHPSTSTDPPPEDNITRSPGSSRGIGCQHTEGRSERSTTSPRTSSEVCISLLFMCSNFDTCLII